MQTKRVSNITIVLMVVITILAIIGAVVVWVNPNFIFDLQPGELQPGGETPFIQGGIVYDVIYVLMTSATYVLYLLGGGLIFFGAMMVTIKFVQRKTRDPIAPSGVTHLLSGYLTLGLAFFIGAEIIKTVIVRTPEEFTLLILVIVSRGLFSLILYLEERWHAAAETE